MLNLGVSLWTKDTNITWSACGGGLVEYNADKSKHKVLGVVGASVVADSPIPNSQQFVS